MSPYFDTGPYGFRCGARSTLPSLPIDGSLGRDSSEFPSSCGKQNGTSDFDSLHMWVHADEADPETSQCFLVAFQNHARRVLFFGHTHNVNIQPESAHSRSTPAHTHTRTRNHTHTHTFAAHLEPLSLGIHVEHVRTLDFCVPRESFADAWRPGKTRAKWSRSQMSWAWIALAFAHVFARVCGYGVKVKPGDRRIKMVPVTRVPF